MHYFDLDLRFNRIEHLVSIALTLDTAGKIY